MTDPEIALEPHIAALGERYRAQCLFPAIYHIADFALLDRRIIIEVDGHSHLAPEQRWKDLNHSLWLERNGWAVVRVLNEEAKSRAAYVIESLPARVQTRPSYEELEKALGQLTPPPRKRRGKRSRSTQALLRGSAPQPRAA